MLPLSSLTCSHLVQCLLTRLSLSHCIHTFLVNPSADWLAVILDFGTILLPSWSRVFAFGQILGECARPRLLPLAHYCLDTRTLVGVIRVGRVRTGSRTQIKTYRLYSNFFYLSSFIKKRYYILDTKCNSIKTSFKSLVVGLSQMASIKINQTIFYASIFLGDKPAEHTFRVRCFLGIISKGDYWLKVPNACLGDSPEVKWELRPRKKWMHWTNIYSVPCFGF